MTESAASGPFTEALLRLGFSQYEAKSYVGLLGPEGLTGYGVAKLTGVPQPKVYEALRKLVARGAAREVSGEPVKFVAVSPEELLSDLQSSFDQRLEDAREKSRELVATPPLGSLEMVERFDTHTQIMQSAAAAVAAATRRIYVSATSPELVELQGPLEEAARRHVDVVVLAFGGLPFGGAGIRVFDHASTRGVLYRAHQARHLALVVDSRDTVHAVAADGDTWQGIRTASMPIIAAVKGYIRHDIDLQQVFADFSEELIRAYGPGLQKLGAYRQDPLVGDDDLRNDGNRDTATG